MHREAEHKQGESDPTVGMEVGQFVGVWVGWGGLVGVWVVGGCGVCTCAQRFAGWVFRGKLATRSMFLDM